jgi:hypothetical protein
MKIKRLQLEIDEIKQKSLDDSNDIFEMARTQFLKKQAEYQAQITTLIVTISLKLQKYKKSDDEIYQREIENLQKQLTNSKINVPTSKTTSQLTTLLAQRELEISFLKDTVRIECEERMGLVSIVHNLKNEVVRSVSTPPKLPEHPPKSNLNDSELSKKEKGLHALFQAAVAKKEKKLQRQRRS